MASEEICDAAEGAAGQRAEGLFRARLDQIVDMGHPLAKLARAIAWGFLEQNFGAVYADVPGRPLPLPMHSTSGACRE